MREALLIAAVIVLAILVGIRHYSYRDYMKRKGFPNTRRKKG